MTIAVGLKAARYQILDELGSGSMGVVYRALDRLTGQYIALKEVTTERGTLRFNENETIVDGGDSITELRIALAREFRTLASLRHPNIITVLDYGFDAGQPYFTMELLEEADTILDAGKDASLETKMRLVAQILHALIYVQRRGVVHRDLKPENVMVVDGQVKILDFGLAIAQSSQDDSAAGTIAYMAPEVLTGQPASFSSDLYAVGMMTYELIAGFHPFDIKDLTHLIEQTMRELPDIEALDVDVHIAIALEKVLSKSPSQRYQSARSLLQMFEEGTEITLQREDETQRESFLQAAEFVGRDEPMARLNDALQTAQHGQGSAWLIGGESGVGKSRLLEELRTQAMVQGMVVLRGQAVEEASVPYTLWRDPMRALALWTDVQPDEARILQPLLPDIGDLLGITLEEDDSPPSREKLFKVIEKLFRRQRHPTLLILEDLQWASESILLLHHIAQLVTDWPLVIMGSFRDDERPDLHLSLGSMEPIKLSRLSPDEIADLSVSMLGEEVGRNSDIVRLLQNESEGNVLFIIEVVRTLAERAGRLDEVAYQTLPDEIFSGSIQAVVQRRLEHLPAEMIDLLQVAAITGRMLDIAILKQLNTRDFTLDSWLVVCSDASVLEIQDEQWRFVHDKIRMALINMLDEEQKQQLHGRVADALENLDKEAKVKRHALIAYHREQAGQIKRALPHLEQAARDALRDYANEYVVDYLGQAIYLDTSLKAQDEKDGATKEVRAHWERMLGEAMDVDGDHAAAIRHYERVLNYLDPDASGTSISNYSKIDKTVTFLTQEQSDALYACDRLLILYLYDGEWEKAEAIITRVGTIYFDLGDQRSWINTLVTTAWIDFFQGNFSGAEKGFQQSFSIGRLRKLPTMLVAGGAGLVLVMLRHGIIGEHLEKALEDLDTALEATTDEPSSQEKILLHGARGLAYLALGQPEKARELAKAGLALINITSENQLFDFVAYTSVAETLLELWESGYTDDTLKADTDDATSALHSFAQIVPIARPRAWMYQGRANWLDNQKRRAVRALELAIMETRQLNMPYDEGIAYYHLGKLGAKEDPDAPKHLLMAINRLESVGAVEQLRNARQVLETITSYTDDAT